MRFNGTCQSYVAEELLTRRMPGRIPPSLSFKYDGVTHAAGLRERGLAPCDPVRYRTSKSMWQRLTVLVFLCVSATLGSASAQTNLQLWGDVSLNWVPAGKMAYALDLEPQALAADTQADSPGWAALGVTPNAEYSAKKWLDLIGEVGTGYTWRAELVYVWTKSRNTIDEPFTTSDNAISFTVRRFYK